NLHQIQFKDQIKLRAMETREHSWLPIPITVSLILLGWVIARLVPSEGPEVAFQILGSPLGLRFTPAFWIGIFSAALAATGTESLLQFHPRFREEAPWRQIGRLIPSIWVAVGGLTFTLQLPLSPLWLIGLGLGGAALTLAMLGERYRLETTGVSRLMTPLLTQALIYLVTLAAIVWIFQSGLRTLVLMLISGILAAGLALARLVEAEIPERRRWLYVALIGWSMATVAAAFRYWTLSAVTLGLWWMILLYELVEMSLWHLQGRVLSPRVAVEFGSLGFLIALLARWVAG
ncbi:MAG: hypothetical protein NZM16_08245, partial [Thermoflexus sp.]|uniref:DUF5656 family protein n=2 Tax=Thermoflexus sp. TaxID=1969742 RepID=UPI0025F9777E